MKKKYRFLLHFTIPFHTKKWWCYVTYCWTNRYRCNNNMFLKNYTYVILLIFYIFFNYCYISTIDLFWQFRFFSFFVILLCIDATDATELLPTVREKLFFIWKLFVHTRKQHDWLLYCRNNTANVTIYFSYFTCDIKSWFKKRRLPFL